MSSYRDHLRSMGGMLGEQAADEIEELEEAYALLFKENAALKEKLAALSAQPAPGAVEALQTLRSWFETQRKAISKACGSTWDMMQCAEQIEFIDRALRAKEKV